MLSEPERDAAREAADQALAEAVRARLAAGAHASPDARALAERGALVGLEASEAAVVRAVLGRLDAVTGPPTVVWGGVAQALAADRFGLGSRAVADPDQGLAAAREGARALLELSSASAWWGRLLAEPKLRIVGALPDRREAMPRALLIQDAPVGPTGDDRTFWATDSALPAALIVAALADRGLAAEPLIQAGGLKLFMLAGYVQAEDGRLNGAPGRLTGVLGAAPIF